MVRPERRCRTSWSPVVRVWQIGSTFPVTPCVIPSVAAVALRERRACTTIYCVIIAHGSAHAHAVVARLVVPVVLRRISIDQRPRKHRVRLAADLVLDGEEDLPAVEVDDVLKTIFVLAELDGKQTRDRRAVDMDRRSRRCRFARGARHREPPAHRFRQSSRTAFRRPEPWPCVRCRCPRQSPCVSITSR